MSEQVKKVLQTIPTSKLIEELRAREGVEAIDVCPYVPYELHVKADGDDPAIYRRDTGPAVLLVVTD
ncbi:MAG: BC1881 family protein [Dehalococcoidales bacterium]